MTIVLLTNPKNPHNVGGAIRACHIFGVPEIWWTGERVTDKKDLMRHSGTLSKKKFRLPREERLKEYGVTWGRLRTELDWDDWVGECGFTPVAVEKRVNSELLSDFIHPEKAIYIFGPEDAGIPKSVLAECHRFVRIPPIVNTPLNLAASINVVLYDRFVKRSRV